MTEKNRLRRFWDKAYGYEISDSEYKQYKGRLVKFFELLIAIEKREKVLKKIEHGESNLSNRCQKSKEKYDK